MVCETVDCAVHNFSFQLIWQTVVCARVKWDIEIWDYSLKLDFHVPNNELCFRHCGPWSYVDTHWRQQWLENGTSPDSSGSLASYQIPVSAWTWKFNPTSGAKLWLAKAMVSHYVGTKPHHFFCYGAVPPAWFSDWGKPQWAEVGIHSSWFTTGVALQWERRPTCCLAAKLVLCLYLLFKSHLSHCDRYFICMWENAVGLPEPEWILSVW